MSAYAYIREQVVQGVIRAAATAPQAATLPPSLDRIRMIFDAAFFAVNSAVAEAYATDQDRRELLRTPTTLTFVAGDAIIPTATLKKFTEDASLVVGTTQYGFRRYPQWQRGGDPRLGLWTTIGETIKAKTPQPVTAYSGSATFTSIASPDVPATEDDEFDAPEDYVSDLIAALVQYIMGQTMETAAATA